MNRNKIDVTITIDELVYDKVIKYIKKKNLPSFDDFTNRVLENKMKFVKTQTENYYKVEQRKSQWVKEKARKRNNKSPVLPSEDLK